MRCRVLAREAVCPCERSSLISQQLSRCTLESVTLDPQAVDCDAWWLKQIAAANLGRIDLECGGEFVKLRLKSEADIARPVPAHSATGRLVGEHAIAVVLNSGDVVKGSQQRAGIKNGHDAVRTVRATILYDAGFHGGNTAVALNSGLQID